MDGTEELKKTPEVKKKTPWYVWAGGIIMVALLIYGVYMRTTAGIGQECCDKVCGEIGATSCVGFTDKEIYCNLKYERFGMPEISEVYRFQVNNKSICKPAVQPIVDNMTIENASLVR